MPTQSPVKWNTTFFIGDISEQVIIRKIKIVNAVISFYFMLDKSRLNTELELIFEIEDLKQIVHMMNVFDT